jgi:hypothetical protein
MKDHIKKLLNPKYEVFLTILWKNATDHNFQIFWVRPKKSFFQILIVFCRDGRVKPFFESSRVRVILKRFRVESSYFYHFLVFLFISIKNVNNKFFMIRSLLPSFYAQKDRIFPHKIKWYNHYRFINKIRTSKWTFLVNRTRHQNSQTVIFYQQKLNLNLFTSKKYLFIFTLREKCVLITKIV